MQDEGGGPPTQTPNQLHGQPGESIRVPNATHDRGTLPTHTGAEANGNVVLRRSLGDLPRLASGATANVDVAVPSLRRGDFADASLDTTSIAFVLDCDVGSNDKVRVTARNVSASAVDLAAVGAGAVLHQELPLHQPRHVLRQHPRGEVHRPARRDGDDHADRACVGLDAGGGRQQGGRG